MRCCKQEHVCPYCERQGGHKAVNEVMFDCSAYKVVRCSGCDNKYAIPYLLTFDDDRPDDEMEVDL